MGGRLLVSSPYCTRQRFWRNVKARTPPARSPRNRRTLLVALVQNLPCSWLSTRGISYRDGEDSVRYRKTASLIGAGCLVMENPSEQCSQIYLATLVKVWRWPSSSRIRVRGKLPGDPACISIEAGSSRATSGANFLTNSNTR